MGSPFLGSAARVLAVGLVVILSATVHAQITPPCHPVIVGNNTAEPTGGLPCGGPTPAYWPTTTDPTYVDLVHANHIKAAYNPSLGVDNRYYDGGPVANFEQWEIAGGYYNSADCFEDVENVPPSILDYDNAGIDINAQQPPGRATLQDFYGVDLATGQLRLTIPTGIRFEGVDGDDFDLRININTSVHRSGPLGRMLSFNYEDFLVIDKIIPIAQSGECDSLPSPEAWEVLNLVNTSPFITRFKGGGIQMWTNAGHPKFNPVLGEQNNIIMSKIPNDQWGILLSNMSTCKKLYDLSGTIASPADMSMLKPKLGSGLPSAGPVVAVPAVYPFYVSLPDSLTPMPEMSKFAAPPGVLETLQWECQGTIITDADGTSWVYGPYYKKVDRVLCLDLSQIPHVLDGAPVLSGSPIGEGPKKVAYVQLVAPCLYKETRSGLRTTYLYNRWGQLNGFRDPLGREVWFNYGDDLEHPLLPNEVHEIIDQFGRKCTLSKGDGTLAIGLPRIETGAPQQQELDRTIYVRVTHEPFPSYVGQFKPRIQDVVERRLVTRVQVSSPLDPYETFFFDANFEKYAWNDNAGHYEGTRVESVHYQSNRNPSWMLGMAGGLTEYAYSPNFQVDCDNYWVEVSHPDTTRTKHHFTTAGNEILRQEMRTPSSTTYEVETEFAYASYHEASNTLSSTTDAEGLTTTYTYEEDLATGLGGPWDWYQELGSPYAWDFFSRLNLREKTITPKPGAAISGAPLTWKWDYAERYRQVRAEYAPGQSVPEYRNFYDYDENIPGMGASGYVHPDFDAMGKYTKIRRGGLIKSEGREVTTGLGPFSPSPQTRDTWYEYNDFAQPIRVTTPYVEPTTSVYHCLNDTDGDGSIDWILQGGEACGLTDFPGYLKSETVFPSSPSGPITTAYSYNPWGNRIEEIDPEEVHTFWLYNEDHQVYATGSGEIALSETGDDLVSIGPAFTKQYIYFDQSGNATRTEQWNDNADTAGATVVPNYITTRFDYDGLDRLVASHAEIAAFGQGSQWATHYWMRDPMGRITKQIAPDGSCVQVWYSPLGKVTDRREYATKYTIDPLDNLASDLPPGALDKTLTLTWDDTGNLLTRTDALGATETYHYDGYGRIVGRTDPATTLLFHTLDAEGRILQEDLFVAGTQLGDSGAMALKSTAYAYDEGDRLIRKDDLWVDAAGAAIDDGGATTKYFYDAEDRVVAVEDDRGAVTVRTYDEKHRLTSVVPPIGGGQNKDVFAYDRADNLTRKEIHELVPSTGATVVYAVEFEYDRLNREIRAIRGPGTAIEAVSETAYDSRGLVIHTLEPKATGTVGTRFEYDTQGRLLRSLHGYQGDLVTPAPDLFQTPHNADGLVTLTKSYDLYGHLLTETDDLGNVTTYEHDALHRLKRTIYADGSYEEVDYRPDDLVEELRAFDSTSPATHLFTLEYEYDAAKRRTGEEYVVLNGPYTGLREKNFVYDDMGRVTWAEALSEHPLRPNETVKTITTRSYDSLSRMLTDQQELYKATEIPIQSWNLLYDVDVGFETDGNGNVSKTTSNRGSWQGSYAVERTFDELNRLDEVWDSGGASGTVLRAKHTWRGTQGRLDAIAFGPSGTPVVNNVYTDYDARGRLGEQRTETPSSTLLAGRKWKYAPSGVKTHELKIGPAPLGNEDFAFMHDSLDRLTTIEKGPWDEQLGAFTSTPAVDAMEFDGVGSIRVHTPPGEPTYTHSTNELNAYDDRFDGELVTIDERGNCSEIGVMNLVFDVFGHVVATIRPWVEPVIPIYEARDAFDRRVFREISGAKTYFVHAGEELFQEVALAGNPLVGTVEREYVHGTGIDTLVGQRFSGVPYYYHTDVRGTPYAATDATGAVVERYDIGPFGEVDVIVAGGGAELGNRIGMVGMWYDGEYTNLYSMRARHYSPFLRRFVSKDPLGVWGVVIHLGNPFAYAGNNVTILFDPTGLVPQWLRNAGAAVGGWLVENDLEGFVRTGTQVTGGAVNGAVSAISLGALDADNALQSLGVDTSTTTFKVASGVSGAAISTAVAVASGGASTGAKVLATASQVAGVKNIADNVHAGVGAATNGHGLQAAVSLTIAAVGVVNAVQGTGPETGDGGPISMDEAVARGANHVGDRGVMEPTGSGNNYQFRSTETNAAGDTETRISRFDVNPADRHVQKAGPHLNLETQVNGQIVSNPHTPIDPSTVRPGDHPK